jgi:hypothetical protein
VFKTLGTDLSVYGMIVRKILKSVGCFVKDDKTYLKFLGHYVGTFCQKNLGRTVRPQGIFYPRDALSSEPLCSRDVATSDGTS